MDLDDSFDSNRSLGNCIGSALFKDNRSKSPVRFKEKFSTLYRIVFNKYYVDEFYQKTVINGALIFFEII